VTSRSRSKRSASSSGTPELPDVFIDRSLGRFGIARRLREAGFKVETMAEAYSEKTGQRIPDPKWIRRAARRGMVILTCDDRLLRDHGNVIRQVGAKVFVLPHGHLKEAGTSFALLEASIPDRKRREEAGTRRISALRQDDEEGPALITERPTIDHPARGRHGGTMAALARSRTISRLDGASPGFAGPRPWLG
jgi:hypothetical protein